jgi:hypothetical protein
MAFQDSLFVPARATVENHAELAVRRFTATRFCVPYVGFEAGKLYSKGVDMTMTRRIEVEQGVHPDYLGDPTALAGPMLQLTSEERL